MFGLFNKKPPKEQPPVPSQPAAPVAASAAPSVQGIAYYPQLIEELIDDHRQLEILCQHVKRCFDTNDLTLVAQELGKFGSLLRNHLLKENMRLYIYLKQRVANDEINTALVNSFRKEMDGIARQALDFLDKYKTIETMSSQELRGFIEEIERISAVASERMQREERELYPLYAPAY